MSRMKELKSLAKQAKEQKNKEKFVGTYLENLTLI